MIYALKINFFANRCQNDTGSPNDDGGNKNDNVKDDASRNNVLTVRVKKAKKDTVLGGLNFF